MGPWRGTMPKGFGATVKTIGRGGNFSTFADAMGWLGSQQLYDIVDTSGLIGTITQWSDEVDCTSDPVVAGVRTGDLLYVTDDAHTFGAFGQQDYHYYPILVVGGQAQTTPYEPNKRITLATGIIGETKNNSTLTIVRPRKYAFLVLPGEHIANQDLIPDTVNLSIIGHGDSSVITGGNLLVPENGYLTIGNLYGSESSIIDNGTIGIFPNINGGNGTAFLNISDLRLRGVGNVWGSMNCAGAVVTDVLMDGIYDHPYIPNGDYVYVNNFHVNTHEPTEGLNIAFEGPYRNCTTKQKFLRNISVTRNAVPADVSRGAASMIAVKAAASATGTFDLFLENVFVTDHQNDPDVARNPYDMYISCPTVASGVSARINISNATLHHTGTNLGNLDVRDGDNAEILLRNVKRRDGSPIDVTFTSNPTVHRFDDNESAENNTAATGSITPNTATYATHSYLLTGNITINAPTSPRNGQRTRFVMQQDATGSRAITWDPAFRVHTNPTGTANQKAVFEFEFDGSEWVQVNTPGWS